MTIHFAPTVAEYNPAGPWLRSLGGSPGDIALLGGYYSAGDGGGGQFFWSSAPLVDDGGIAINHGQTVGQTGPGWRRIWSGALNVQWFGAIPGMNIDCALPIGRALTAARSKQFHAAIYFPAGEYTVKSPIVIPRGPQMSGWKVYGDGAGISSLVFMATAAQDGIPLLSFDSQLFEVFGFVLEGLSLVRYRPGPVVRYRPLQVPGSPEDLAMRHSVLRNLWIYSNESPFAPGFPGYSAGPALELDYVRDLVIENVAVDGCEVGLLLKDSARCTLTNVSVCLLKQQESRHGIVIQGGGGHVLTNLTLGPMGSNAHPGHAITLATGTNGYGPKQCLFLSAEFEGRHTADAVRIEAGSELTFHNFNPPGHGTVTHQQRGFYVGPACRHVDFYGGWANNYTGTQQGSVAIEVADGAKDIRFHGVHISAPFSYGEVRLPNPADPGFASRNVGGQFGFGATGSVHEVASEIEVGMEGVTIRSGSTLSIRGQDTCRVNAFPGGEITRVDGGYDGQRLVLVGVADGPDLLSSAASGNLRLASSRVSLSAGATVTLSYQARLDIWTQP